ncbi:Stk1 family PASTA domain-containing Ser/Thr kinase [Amycolatopsis azurea]|uniref:non-specific serine/threonine protein kinase n=1 Tax=Amycolatopsis azurea DSM 43854 TaxID=1238180 RepID=M2NRT8_9PSEU|nr:Stk1 family PASTA domain-containing Ser/Thr kinase [Amycolatopsis azurea]EMD25039.1 Serine/threonine protein kinase PrkC, regulator of stationary phase [Amycolatopsis azurea DSM 43854]OOC05309.1 serine/threonine protein kinase [Amycolatopsis azurea DSM 43854]
MSTPRLLSNRYELGETLGYGGMSEVHHGHDVRLGREVAIKILRADLARDPQFQERFRREAQNAAALNHPAIVAVYDTGETNTEFGPLPYIVMEYVEGRTLRDIVKTEGPMSQKRAMEVMADVCAALDFSHRHGIVHRDVKPANVMITKNGAVKVMDFGIARAMHDGQSAMTQTAAVIGTAQYLSPEQARGESVDARSDVYAAGCVLYELITGEPPFTGDSPVAVAYQHVREDPNPPSSVNPAVAPELDAVVLKALAKGPANRYQSSAEMRSDLVRTLSGQRPSAPMVMSEDERTQVMDSDRRVPQRYDQYEEDDEDPAAKKKRRAWLIAGLVVSLAAIVLLIMWLSNAFGGTSAESKTIPAVMGQSEATAKDTLRGAGFNSFEPTKKVPCTGEAVNGLPACDENDIDKVIAISPKEGQVTPTTDKITLTVGAKPGKVKTPDLKGKTQAEALAALTEAGLKLGATTEEETNDPNEAGKVLSQNPAAQAEVDQGSKVDITVAKSKELKTVQNYKGKTRAEAEAGLKAAGFTPSVTTTSSDQPKDTVIDQTPNGGKLAVGSVVKLSVSDGSQETFDMPNLKGMTDDQATRQLQQLGWSGQLNTQADKNGDRDLAGKVSKTNPQAGAKVAKNAPITLFVVEDDDSPTTSSSSRGFPLPGGGP